MSIFIFTYCEMYLSSYFPFVEHLSILPSRRISLSNHPSLSQEFSPCLSSCQISFFISPSCQTYLFISFSWHIFLSISSYARCPSSYLPVVRNLSSSLPLARCSSWSLYPAWYSSWSLQYILLETPLDLYILLDIPLNISPCQIYISIQPSRWISLPISRILPDISTLTVSLSSSLPLIGFLSSSLLLLDIYCISSLLLPDISLPFYCTYSKISIHLSLLQDISLHLYLLQDASRIVHHPTSRVKLLQ